MSSPALHCPDCRTPFDEADNYCRNCGMYLPAARAVSVSELRTPAVPAERAGLPAPVRKAATAVAIGAALQIGVGLAGRYLVRQAARQAVASSPGRRPVRRGRDERRKGGSDLPDDVAAVNETVLIHRMWIRRGPG